MNNFISLKKQKKLSVTDRRTDSKNKRFSFKNEFRFNLVNSINKKIDKILCNKIRRLSFKLHINIYKIFIFSRFKGIPTQYSIIELSLELNLPKYCVLILCCFWIRCTSWINAGLLKLIWKLFFPYL